MTRTKLIYVLIASLCFVAGAKADEPTPVGKTSIFSPSVHSLCESGYTKTVRPPVSYTDAIKVKLFAQYKLTGAISDYELDHFIPLELDGNPTSLDNLWMQPWAEARLKDVDETRLRRDMCAGKTTLQEAQAFIVTKWSKK